MNHLMLVVRIANRKCALHAHDVGSIIEIGDLTSVPRAPNFIAGIAALRSQALTAIDCRKALGFHADSWPTDSRASVTKIDGHAYALIVDAIEDVATSLSEPEQITGGFGPEWARVTTGLIETSLGPALLLDLEALVAGPDDQNDSLGAVA